MPENSKSEDFYENNEGTFGDNNYFDRQFATYNKEESEKRKLKIEAFIIGVPLIIAGGISEFWSKIYFYIAARLGFSQTAAYNFAVDSGISQIFQIVLSCFMFIIPFALSVKIAGRSVSSRVPFKRVKKKQILPFFALGVAFCFFASVMVSFSGSLFESFGVNYSVDFGENPEGFFGIALTVISTAIVPALVEEFAFRGIILGGLLQFGDAFAIISSSLIFGIMHGNFVQMPFAFLVGLILGYIRVKTDSLWLGILIHFFNNFTSVLNDYLVMGLSAEVISVIYSIMICLFFALGIISIIYIAGKDDFKAFELSSGEYKIQEKSKYLWLFTSLPILAVLGLYIVRSFKYFL